MKKIRLIFMFIICAFALCACSKSSVKPASEKEVTKWCKEEFGKASVVTKEEAADTIYYTMKDSQNGFLYTVTSYVHGVGMDGSTFWYQESKKTDFDEKYLENFYNKNKKAVEDIESKYNVKILNEKYGSLFKIVGLKEEKIKDAAKALIKLEKGFDKRDYWKNVEIELCLGDEAIGHYEEDKEYVSTDDEYVNWLLECAAIDMKVSVKDLKFVKMETAQCKDIPGYNPDRLVSVLGSDNDTKTTADVCYFEYRGELYFVTDIVMYNERDIMVHLGDYPVRK